MIVSELIDTTFDSTGADIRDAGQLAYELKATMTCHRSRSPRQTIALIYRETFLGGATRRSALDGTAPGRHRGR